MAKWLAPAAYDAMLNYAAESDRLYLCTAQPGTYTEATSTYSLGYVTLTAGAGNGDYTLGANQTGGRILTTLVQSVTPSASGNVTHAALVKSGDTTLRAVTTTPVVALTSGVAVPVGEFTWDGKGAT